jgi:hypothetical protein
MELVIFDFRFLRLNFTDSSISCRVLKLSRLLQFDQLGKGVEMGILERKSAQWLVWLGLFLLLSAGCGLAEIPENGEAGQDMVTVTTVFPQAPVTPTPLPITGAKTADPLPPQLYLTNLGSEEVGARQPAYLRLELAGTAVTTLTLQISRHTDDGSFRPLSRQPLLATLPGDGVHHWPLVWYGDGPVADGEDETADVQQHDNPFMAVVEDMPTPRQPLPAGRYRLAVFAQNETGAAAEAFVDLTLTIPDEPPAGRTYLDPQHGFQFHYPHDWQTPVYSGTLLLSRHLTVTGQMQLIRYPELPPRTNQMALADQTLERFGRVSRLYQDQLPLADTRARRVAYGYTHADGAGRTGVLLTFVHGGQGYVVDIEGDAIIESTLWAMAELVATSWQFVMPADGPPPHWAGHTVAGWSLAYPRDYTYQELRGWHRFSRDRDTFWALRSEEEITADATELARRLQDAAAGVANFSADPATYFELGSRQWLRADFRYTNSRDQRIQGAILLGEVEEQTAVVWLEAPIDEYDRLEQAHFLLMLAAFARSS